MAEFKDLGEILRKHPEAVSVLQKHGVHVCASCVITLFSNVEKAAAYHAVPDLKAFLGDLREFLETKGPA